MKREADELTFGLILARLMRNGIIHFEKQR
jgi:hypothetical protein